MIACKNQSLEIVRELFHSCGNLLDPNRVLSASALSTACNTKNLPLLNLLLSHRKIDVNKRLQRGGSVLHHVCHLNLHEVFPRLLRVRGVDVNALSAAGLTPLMVACMVGAQQIANALLDDQRTNPTLDDPRGRTALWLAAKYRYRVIFLNVLSRSRVPLDTAKIPVNEPYDTQYQELIDEFNADPVAFREKYCLEPPSEADFEVEEPEAEEEAEAGLEAGEEEEEEEIVWDSEEESGGKRPCSLFSPLQ